MIGQRKIHAFYIHSHRVLPTRLVQWFLSSFCSVGLDFFATSTFMIIQDQETLRKLSCEKPFAHGELSAHRLRDEVLWPFVVQRLRRKDGDLRPAFWASTVATHVEDYGKVDGSCSCANEAQHREVCHRTLQLCEFKNDRSSKITY